VLIPPSQIAWVATLRANLAAKDARILVARRTRIRIKGNVAGGGTLGIGSQWAGLSMLETMFTVRPESELQISGAFRFLSGCHIGLARGAKLTLGSGYMSNEGRISCEHSIIIGNDVAIGPRVSIRDDDGHGLVGSPRFGPIVIGNHVWLGEGVRVLKGVTIGDGVIVAAGSVVTRDLPAGNLCAGTPCRPLRAAEWR
jgi:acetyltransferase-like isoleucine patch superfamily enzyme